jgi:hypothetical protein
MFGSGEAWAVVSTSPKVTATETTISSQAHEVRPSTRQCNGPRLFTSNYSRILTTYPRMFTTYCFCVQSNARIHLLIRNMFICMHTQPRTMHTQPRTMHTHNPEQCTHNPEQCTHNPEQCTRQIPSHSHHSYSHRSCTYHSCTQHTAGTSSEAACRLHVHVIRCVGAQWTLHPKLRQAARVWSRWVSAHVVM